ncbi:ATP-binding protein [Streptomyces sp. TP-A0874]|uniref:ATP-binding protein n=1 Tax=Streptomyces sp. TP-A0874 TaxID=549819 RepID=UPI0008535515|nr:ATP-binding protein [Streptomyces sp. TP-A0874]
MTRHIPEAVFWCLAAGALAALVLLVRQRQITATLRRHLAVLETSLHVRDEELRYLVEARLPALTDAPQQPESVPGLRDGRLAGTGFAESLERVMGLFSGAAEQARLRADQSAKAALKAAMRALQGLANEQQMSISDMQDRHDDPNVLHGLLEIDHANSQFGRRAQAIAVLCGSWPGRQRAASPLVDVVRGAKSRIRDYRRVEVHSRIDVDVVSRAVEPVVLAVAELLDNAARHSQPNTMVEVSVQPAHNGTCIVIDDAGVGMDSREVEEATRLLGGRERIDINRLGDPPQFGFAVIGVLAARYGFNVSVDTRSPYGGVRAVLFLPHALLTSASGASTARAVPPPAPQPPPAPAPQPAPRMTATQAESWPPAQPQPAPQSPPPPAAQASPPPAAQPEYQPEPPRGATAGGLPRRSRRAPNPEAVEALRTPPAQPVSEAPPARPAQETASRMGAFARGTRSGRASSADEGNPQA